MTNINKTLLILAGGLGSRYKGLKQVDGILESGEVLLEFSMYDAWISGFTKFVLIVNRLIPQSFIEKINQIAQTHAFEVHFVYQEISCCLPNPLLGSFPERQKPWGTAHAVLCAKDVINEPFMVINADDFYGRASYQQMAETLQEKNIDSHCYQMIAYPIAKTVSENGSVSRGICTLTSDGFLKQIEEQTQIILLEQSIGYKTKNQMVWLPLNTLVSMNCWLFDHTIFIELQKYFNEFINRKPSNTSEFFIPTVIEQLIESQKIIVRVQKAESDWYGITYPEDKKKLQNQLLKLRQQGLYPNPLWNN